MCQGLRQVIYWHLLLEANVSENEKMIKGKLNLKNRKIVYEN